MTEQESASVSDLSWQACPFARSPLKGMLALAVIGGLACGTALVVESVPAGIAAAVGLIVVLHRFFFPSTHTINQQGVTLLTFFGSRSLPWSRIHHVSHDAMRVYVSPQSRRNAVCDRGLLLLLSDNRERVLSAIAAGRQANSTAESTDADA